MADPAAIRVLYNATAARVGGGLSYACAQIDALAAVDDIALTVVVAPWNRAPLEAAVGDRATVEPVRLPNVAVRYAWEQVWLPVLARRHDVLISPGNFGCLVSPVPQVVVLQNPLYVGHGRGIGNATSWARRLKVALSHISMRRADLVVSISQSLTDEIRSEPRLAGAEVVTVRSGSPGPVEVGEGPSAREVTSAVDALVGSDPYLLSVSNDAPHKRLDDLAAFAATLEQCPDPVPRRVVVVGAVSSERQARLRMLAGPSSDALTMVGSVSDRPVVLELYRRAAAAVSTSELEAWPLTLNEASSQGCPMVATDIPTHREVAEDRARYFPVGDLGAMAAQVEAALGEPRPAPSTHGVSWSEHGHLFAEHLRALSKR